MGASGTAPVGLVLAGGASRRMGRDKRWLVEAGGDAWIERAVRLLQRSCPRGFVSIAAGDRDEAVGGWPCIADAAPAGRGPLAGIQAGLDAAGGADICVLACDYPLMTGELIESICAAPLDGWVRLARDAGGRDHPLVARWSSRTRAEVERALREGRYRVRSLIDGWPVERVDAGRALTNVNDPEQLAALGDERCRTS